MVVKRNRWRKFCERIKNITEASRLHTILSKENKPHLGCIKLSSVDYTGSVENSLGHLMDVQLPGSWRPFGSSGERPMTEGGYMPSKWRLAAKVVYPSGVEWVIKTLQSTRPDGIYPILLHEGLKCLVGPLTKIFRTGIALRHVPQVWKTTKVFFVTKPGKNGHIYAKDFRSICLTFFLLKLLETLVDRFLKTRPLVKHRCLPPNMPTGRASLLRLRYTTLWEGWRDS